MIFWDVFCMWSANFPLGSEEIVTRWTASTKIQYRPHAKAPGSKSHIRTSEFNNKMVKTATKRPKIRECCYSMLFLFSHPTVNVISDSGCSDHSYWHWGYEKYAKAKTATWPKLVTGDQKRGLSDKTSCKFTPWSHTIQNHLKQGDGEQKRRVFRVDVFSRDLSPVRVLVCFDVFPLEPPLWLACCNFPYVGSLASNSLDQDHLAHFCSCATFHSLAVSPFNVKWCQKHWGIWGLLSAQLRLERHSSLAAIRSTGVSIMSTVTWLKVAWWFHAVEIGPWAKEFIWSRFCFEHMLTCTKMLFQVGNLFDILLTMT